MSDDRRARGRGSSGSSVNPPPPPGAGAAEPSMHDMLKSIQGQLVLQTEKMNSLARKEDVLALTNTVDGLSSRVGDQSVEIADIRRRQDDDRDALTARMEELEQKVRDLSSRDVSVTSVSGSFSRDRSQREKYMISRRSLRLWPVSLPPPLGPDADAAEAFLRLRAAVYLFLSENLKVKDPEEIEIEDLVIQRPMRRGNVKDEVLVRFSSVSERDEVIGHAVNLRDVGFPAGVRLDIPGHLQSLTSKLLSNMGMTPGLILEGR